MENTAANAFSAVSSVAPYVIAAYGLIWAALMVYVGLVMRRLGRLERDMAAVEEACGRRKGA